MTRVTPDCYNPIYEIKHGFDTQKNKLASPPVFVAPIEDHPIIIHTDEINYTVGEILFFQKDQKSQAQCDTLGS